MEKLLVFWFPQIGKESKVRMVRTKEGIEQTLLNELDGWTICKSGKK